jgi:Tol biopolymer transport system component
VLVIAAGVGGAVPGWAGAATTERVSVNSEGTQANRGGHSTNPAISADGRFVAFGSDARNLVPDDTSFVCDVFVHDRETDASERVSVGSEGVEANDQSCFEGGPAISADGRFVAFVSLASNLVPGDTNGEYDVFVHDRETGITERVSVSSLGIQAGRRSDSPSISADGRFIAFRSRAGNLVDDDRNGVAQDVFVRDRETGVTERVSVSSTAEEGTKSSAEPSISADGLFVAFKSAAPNLVQGDTNRVSDIFVHNRESGKTWRVSVRSGVQGNRVSYSPSISADGTFVAFTSFASNLVRSDENDDHDVFVRNRRTHQTRRVSITSAGTEGKRGGHDPVISSDGRFVAFGSYSLAYAGDRKREDAFVRDRWLRKTKQVSVSSTGSPGNMHSSSTAISADGRFAVFESIATNLVAGDTNRSSDILVRGPFAFSPPDDRQPGGPAPAHASPVARSAKRSARAAIVSDGFGPTGPGMIEPSAIVKPG